MRFTRAACAALMVLTLAACGHAGEAGAVPAESNPAGEPAPPSPALALAIPSPTSKSALDEGRQAADDLKKAARNITKKSRFTVPYLVGRNLQSAQDALQSEGSYLLAEDDATGAGRLLILDRDWRVCSQSPVAGKRVLVTTKVTLQAVKLHEVCPA